MFWRFKGLFCSFPPAYVLQPALHIWVKEALHHFCLQGEPEPRCTGAMLRLCIQRLQCPRAQYSPCTPHLCWYDKQEASNFCQFNCVAWTCVSFSPSKVGQFNNMVPLGHFLEGECNSSEGSWSQTSQTTSRVCHRDELHVQFLNSAKISLIPDTWFCVFYLLGVIWRRRQSILNVSMTRVYWLVFT